MKKQAELYSGKAKSVFTTDNQELLILEFRDDVSAFNAQKLASLENKGAINNQLNAFFMEKLHQAGIKTHFEKLLSSDESLVKRLDMIPVECVVRNFATGSLCKRLGTEQGLKLEPPIFEFFYKDDDLGDPMINESHIHTFKWASDDEVQVMKQLSLQINKVLSPLFLDKGFLLVDYKLEFGRFAGELLLGDEFTPDGCRIWDAETKQQFDKDLFRNDSGDLVGGYLEVAKRFDVDIDTEKAAV